MNYLKMMKNRPLIDVWHFFVGNYRYKLFYSTAYSTGYKLRPNHFQWLMRTHIREQIKFRCQYIPDACWNTGSCIHCGCQVPQLQMAAKMCGNECYPVLMSNSKWEAFQAGVPVKQGRKTWILNTATHILTVILETPTGYVSEQKPKYR